VAPFLRGTPCGTDSFATTVGGTIGIAIASSVFGTKLSSALREFAPDAPYALVRNSVQVCTPPTAS
jgi:hypothetical protein